MKKINYKTMSVDDLKKCPYNPRKIEDNKKAGLRNSIERFGLVQPIVWNKKTKNVVGGNQRLKILKEKGIKKVTVVEVDISLEEEQALNLALNNKGIEGDFTNDVDILIQKIRNEDPDMYDSLRLFDIDVSDVVDEIDKEDEEQKQDKEIPEMELQPYEHYDYVIILATTAQNWNYLQEFFDLKRVNSSPVGKKKIGLGRGVKAEKFIKKIKEIKNGKSKNSNTKQKKN